MLCLVLLAFGEVFFFVYTGSVMEGGKYTVFHPTITTEFFFLTGTPDVFSFLRCLDLLGLLRWNPACVSLLSKLRDL